MSFQDKLDAANKELSKTKIRKLSYNPPILMLLRKLGLDIRPFHYSTFLNNFILASLWFGCVWGLLMWFTIWQYSQMSVQLTVIVSLSTGLLFGLFMALYYIPNHLKMQDSAGIINALGKALFEDNSCSIVEINNAA